MDGELNYSGTDDLELTVVSILRALFRLREVAETLTGSSDGDKIRTEAGWSAFGKYGEISLDRHLPMSLDRKVFNQYVLLAVTYGCQTWSLTKALVKKLETSQRAVERKMLNAKLKDKSP